MDKCSVNKYLRKNIDAPTNFLNIWSVPFENSIPRLDPLSVPLTKSPDWKKKVASPYTTLQKQQYRIALNTFRKQFTFIVFCVYTVMTAIVLKNYRSNMTLYVEILLITSEWQCPWGFCKYIESKCFKWIAITFNLRIQRLLHLNC